MVNKGYRTKKKKGGGKVLRAPNKASPTTPETRALALRL